MADPTKAYNQYGLGYYLQGSTLTDALPKCTLPANSVFSYNGHSINIGNTKATGRITKITKDGKTAYITFDKSYSYSEYYDYTYETGQTATAWDEDMPAKLNDDGYWEKPNVGGSVSDTKTGRKKTSKKYATEYEYQCVVDGHTYYAYGPDWHTKYTCTWHQHTSGYNYYPTTTGSIGADKVNVDLPISAKTADKLLPFYNTSYKKMYSQNKAYLLALVIN